MSVTSNWAVSGAVLSGEDEADAHSPLLKRHRRCDASDRRSGRRYPMHLPLEYRVMRRRQVESGSGSTVDVSSVGILFETGSPLPLGAKVELSIAWPARLGNSVGLSLAVTGRVVRAEENLTAVRIVAYVFRTRGRSHCAA